jgi:hypothetical protein
MSTARLLLPLLAAACLLSAHGFAQEPDEATHAEAVQMRDYIASFMHGQVAATCAARGYTRSEQLSAAYATWKATLAPSIERGEVALLRHYPEFGGSKDAMLALMAERYTRDTEPAIVADVANACDALVRVLKTGIPVPFSGDSGTDHRLRMDIYNQARMAVTCWQIDSISASVIKADPQGSSVERWTLDGCGKPVPVTVTYSPHAAGGTNFAVGVEGNALDREERMRRLEAAKRLLEQAKARPAAP